MNDFPDGYPTKYSKWNTWELLDLLKTEYWRRPKFDVRGRLLLVPIEPRPLPVELHLELSRRAAEVRSVMEMRQGGLGGMVPNAASDEP